MINEIKTKSCRRDFDDIQINEIHSIKKKLSIVDIDNFMRLSGDVNPLHLNEEYAKQHGFKGPVVYGMLLSSYISTMIGNVIPGEGALWSTQNIEFVSPAFVGDEITITAIVMSKSRSTRTISLKIEITNQDGKLLVRGMSGVRLLEDKSKGKMMQEKGCVLITGASRGIGAAVARELARKGEKIIINYYNNEELAIKLCDEIEQLGGYGKAIRADMSNEKDVENMIGIIEDLWGIPSGIVHAAAPHPIPTSFLETNWDQHFSSQWNVQIRGAYLLAKLLLIKMIENNRIGSFVFLGSIYGEGNPPIQQTGYVTVKSAIGGLSKSLAQEFGPKGIRFNCVAPGMTQTDMIAEIPEKVKMLAKMQTPLRKLALPEDIAKTISFLLGDDSSHITGETIRVCGGIYM